MANSEDCLKEAFAGESQASRRYLAFAVKADQEGYPKAGKLFRAAAEAETIHSYNHLKALKGIRSTKENLQEAIHGELHEVNEMYPDMIATAKSEGNKEAERTFKFAYEVEKVHAELYQKLLDNLAAAQEAHPYYVCPICGYTAEQVVTGACPVCGAKGSLFKTID